MIAAKDAEVKGIMIQVRELADREIETLLNEVQYGHLACCSQSKPYVVPVHYAWDGRALYVYTTEGKKSDIIAENPNVCLQVEEVMDNRHWTSVVIEGVAERLDMGDERGHAVQLIMKVNPTLTPAISVHWMDDWIKRNVEVVYKITPTFMSGRAAVPGFDQPPVSPPVLREL